jgi:hypothetical protein
MHRVYGPLTGIGRQMNQRLADIEEIVAARCCITELNPQDLDPFRNLQFLYIPYNRLTSLAHLEKNIRLKVIDARYNRIRDVDLPGQRCLEELYLAGNCLHSLERFLPKVIHIKDLKVLDLRKNGLTCEPGYWARMKGSFSVLQTLDGRTIQRETESATIKVTEAQGTWSIVDYLESQGPSRAEQIIQKKAMLIKKNRKVDDDRKWQNATAASRKQKADFELAATMRVAPISEALDFLGREMRKKAGSMKVELPDSRPNTRMFLKVPEYSEAYELSDYDSTAIRLNRGNLTSALKVRCDHRSRFPSLSRAEQRPPSRKTELPPVASTASGSD